MTFLYYSWGKALLDFFIGSLCFSTEINPFLQIPVGLLFIAASILFAILAVFTWKKDRMKAQNAHGEAPAQAPENKT